MFEFILLANAIWFGLAFHLFSIRNKIFAKVIVPKDDRNTPVFDVLSKLSQFLGGFNLAFCILNVLILINPSVFPENEQRIILCAVFALAHGTQFFFNVPVALDNKKGKGVWQVKGLMRFIFVTDFLIIIANIAIVLMYVFR